MNTLLSDLRTPKLAPTVRRELTARLVGAIPLLLVVAFVVSSSRVQALMVGGYVLYATVRVGLVAAARTRVGRPAADDGAHRLAPRGQA